MAENERAFPDPMRASPVTGSVEPDSGMTLRDYFAAKAMEGLATRGCYVTHEELAAKAYDIAAEMMFARALDHEERSDG